MLGNSGKCFGKRLLAVIVVGGFLLQTVYAGIGDGGSRCKDTSCTGAPADGCEPKYDRDDGCCPVWTCSNGQTAYGMSKSSSTGSSSFSGSSYSFSSGGGSMPNMPNPMANIMGMFGNLFG